MSQTTPPAVLTDASTATDKDSWLAQIDAIGEEAGYFEPLGKHHWAMFCDESPTLLVTFETIDDIRAASPGQMPHGYRLARKKGWSHLCLIADGDSWYRDTAVYRFFDRLVDDAFFEDFDQVVFYGADMGGYAACAFSVVAPGATVLALQPRATLAPELAGWDNRTRTRRRLDFTDRYGFAPDMTEGAGQVFIGFDPRQDIDAMHAALFNRPWVTPLRCYNLGAQVATNLAQMSILSELILAAGEGKLSAALFARLWRARRDHGGYLRALLRHCNDANKPAREAMICRSVTARMRGPTFRRRLAEIESAGQNVSTATPAPDP